MLRQRRIGFQQLLLKRIGICYFRPAEAACLQHVGQLSKNQYFHNALFLIFTRLQT